MIGVDVDEAVLANPALDEAHVVEVRASLPLRSSSADLVVSDFIFEHVTDPGWGDRRGRARAPTGRLAVRRTPNRWGTSASGPVRCPTACTSACSVGAPSQGRRGHLPDQLPPEHPGGAEAVVPPCPVPPRGVDMDDEPAYIGRSVLAARLTKGIFSLTPPPLRSILLVFLRKHPASKATGGR